MQSTLNGNLTYIFYLHKPSPFPHASAPALFRSSDESVTFGVKHLPCILLQHLQSATIYTRSNVATLEKKYTVIKLGTIFVLH